MGRGSWPGSRGSWLLGSRGDCCWLPRGELVVKVTSDRPLLPYIPPWPATGLPAIRKFGNLFSKITPLSENYVICLGKNWKYSKISLAIKNFRNLLRNNLGLQEISPAI